MMRKIAFIVKLANDREMVTAYKIARQCNPDLKIGEAIASMRDAKPLVELETDCLEALQILDTLVELAQVMTSKEIPFDLHVTEK